MIIVDGVSPSTRKPGVYMEINTKAARVGLPVVADRILLVGVKLSTGSATAGELVQVYSTGEARDKFGSGSPLALMVQALLEQNPYIAELWCFPQAEASGSAAAAGIIAVAASSLTAGTLTIQLGRHAVSLNLSAGDVAADISEAVAAAITAAKHLPFSAAQDGSTTQNCNLTCKAKGTDGNDWKIATDYTGTGLTVTITQPASGSGDPDIEAALDAAFPLQFDVIVSQYNDATNLGKVKAHLNDVSGAMEQRPGVAIAGATGSISTNTTLAAALNSGRMVVCYMRGTRTHPYELAAGFAGALLSEADRARPLNFLAIKVAVAPDNVADRLSRTEQESCLYNGLAPLMVGAAGEVQVVRSVTTYTLDTYGSADDTLLDIQTIRVLDYVRYAVRVKLQQKLGRAKIADLAVTPNTTDPDKIRAMILGVLLQCQNDLGYLERVEEHADRLVVERDGSSPGRVNASIPADIVDGLHVMAATIDLILG